MPASRRYPILGAFVVQLYEEVTDEVMDLFIPCLTDTYAEARHDLETFRSLKEHPSHSRLHDSGYDVQATVRVCDWLSGDLC